MESGFVLVIDNVICHLSFIQGERFVCQTKRFMQKCG